MRNLFISLLIFLASISLFVIGIYNLLISQVGSGATSLGFAFLLTILLLLSKFKRFKGFGFEAETWEQKQEEAAVLVDKLKLLSEISCEQIALQAVKIGMWGGALTVPELGQLLENLNSALNSAESTKTRKFQILSPIYDRIELALIGFGFSGIQFALRQRVTEILQEQNNVLTNEPNNLNKVTEVLDKLKISQEEDRVFSLYNREKIMRERSITDLHKYLVNLQMLGSGHIICTEILELEKDLQYFKEQRKLRRQKDYNEFTHLR